MYSYQCAHCGAGFECPDPVLGGADPLCDKCIMLRERTLWESIILVLLSLIVAAILLASLRIARLGAIQYLVHQLVASAMLLLGACFAYEIHRFLKRSALSNWASTTASIVVGFAAAIVLYILVRFA